MSTMTPPLLKREKFQVPPHVFLRIKIELKCDEQMLSIPPGKIRGYIHLIAVKELFLSGSGYIFNYLKRSIE